MTRSVETIFTAKVDGYLANVTRMKAATADMAKSGAANMKAHGADWDKIGKASTVAGLAIGAAVVYSAKKYMDFEAAMSKVGAVANSTAKEQKALGEAALKAGQDTVFSATQAAEAEAELLKAGISVSDVLGGALTGSLNLAAAGQIGLAQSAEIAAQAMNIFNLEGQDVGHIADVLTAGANKSAAGVDDLGMALAQGGLVAKQTGLTLEETVGTLSAFADNSLKGSDAGTSLKTMLQRLNPTSAEAANLMDELGLRAYDSQGNFVGLAEYAGMLQDAMSDMTPEMRNAAMATLFGSDAVRGANVLYEQGEAGMRKYIAAVDDQGAAARMAARQTDNLKGDIERLKGTLETAFIKAGSGGNDGIRSVVQALESVVEGFNKLSPATQSYIVKAAAVAAAMLLLTGGVVKAVGAVQSLKAAYVATGLAGSRFATTTGAATKGVAKLAAAFAVLAVASQFGGSDEFGVNALAKDLRAADDPLKAINAELERTAVVANGSDYPIRNLGDALKEAFDPGAFNGVQKVIGGIANAFGGDFKTDSQFAAIQLDRVGQSLAKLVQDGKADEAAAAFAEISAQAKAQGISTEDLLRKMPAYQAALDESAIAATNAAGGMEEIGSAAQAAEVSVSELADTIRGFGSAAMSADEAESAFQESLDATRESADEHRGALEMTKGMLDLSTKGAREAAGSLRTLATDTKGASASIIEMGGSQEDAAAKMARGRAEFIKNATQMGLTKKEAERLADAYGLIPEDVKTEVSAPGAVNARQQTQAFIDRIKAIPQSKTAKIAAQTSGIGSLEYMKRLVDSMNSKSVTVRYTTVRRTIGGSTIDGADGHVLLNTGAGLVRSYAGGGFWDGTLGAAQPEIRSAGGQGVRWAEEGAGPWEAFISGHPAKKVRSRGIAEDTVDRLGGAITWVKPMADGGTMTRSLADQVRGLAPRAASSGGVVNHFGPTINIDGALDPVAVGAQVERVLQDYTSVTGRPLQVMTR